MKPEKGQEIRRRLNIPDKFVLYAGTIEPRKNLSQLVRAFEKVSKEMNSDLQLVLAGRKGWVVDDLYKSLRKSQAGKNVVFTGYLNDNELCALYSSCRLFVYPSFYEGFGLPPLEAMACGAPVIASRIPSIAEVVGPAARLVSPHSSKELADAMGDVLSNDSLRQELVAAGVKRAKEFSWEWTAERTRAVYLEAIDRFKHP
jgi:glycosyltransferase involved in cell wall biosynthesis